MTVDVPCASTLPALSETLASHLPVSARIGREKLPFVSMVAWTFPGAVDQRQRPSAMHAPQRIQQMRPRLALAHAATKMRVRDATLGALSRAIAADDEEFAARMAGR